MLQFRVLGGGGGGGGGHCEIVSDFLLKCVNTDTSLFLQCHSPTIIILQHYCDQPTCNRD